MPAGAAGSFPDAASGGDAYDEAEPAFSTPVAAPAVSDDGEGPPLEELESQMREELASREVSVNASPAARRSAAADDEESEGKGAALPELDTLVERLPTEVRETLDELFRARFVSVKKLPKKLFQAATSKRAGAD